MKNERMNASSVMVDRRDEIGAAGTPASAGQDRHRGTLPDGLATSPETMSARPEDTAHVLGSMVHEVSNVLNSVMAAAQLVDLLLGQNRADEARASLAQVEDECLRAARLLRDGRGLATLEVPPSQGGVELDVLLSACALACADLGDVQVHCDPALPRVHGHIHALKRLCVEIMDNAFQFGARALTVTARAATDARAVEIEFADDGPGLRLGAPKLFAAFATSEPAEHSGLGLAYAARIAAEYGGELGIGAADSGARFWLRLPLEDAGGLRD